ncbi:hypothetical protein B7Z17_05205, partial [Candidatus Saccharibacteria bacterium 32-49-10]
TSIVTASYEAKARGVKVGMKIAHARLLCPGLVALESDPPKYRYVYRRLMAILEAYSPMVRMKSIDEGLIDFSESPREVRERDLLEAGREIKARIREEIGEYMLCNIGIGTNRFLAKTAAGFNKPDGLTIISSVNLREMYGRLVLEDLTGIAGGYGRRLRQVGITTPLEFLDAEEVVLDRQVFHGKPGRDWYRRLRGWEVDDVDFAMKSVGGRGRGDWPREIGVSCYDFVPSEARQPDLFGEMIKTAELTAAVDEINQFWGARTVHSADTLGLDGQMKRRVPFGSTRFLG